VQEQDGDAALPGRAEPLGPGDPAAIGAYELIGKLGEGGMGTVYLGRNADDRLVAVKIIRPELAADPTYRARFRDEVDNAQRVASFCTAQVLGHGLADGRPYLVTEYVDGQPLEEYIETQGALPSGTLHGVAVGVAAALTAIHSAGLVHRDLKPANVLLSVSGPRVIDFGIARATNRAADSARATAPKQHTQDGIVMGSPGWMAPEQVLRGEIGTAVDVFAWGTLVAIAGTGRHPYGVGSVIAMAARAGRGGPDLDGLSEPLYGLVSKALDPDPDRRPSAQQLLLSLVGGTAGGAEGGAMGDAQTVADRELDRTWRTEPPLAIPLPWVPPSPPHGVPVPGGTRQYTAAAPLPGPPADAGPHALPHAAPPAGPPPTPTPRPTPRPTPTPPPTPPPPPPPVATRPRARRPRAQPPLMLPAYADARRARRRRSRLLGCSVTALVLISVLIIGLVALAAATRPAEGRRGRPAADGQFTFVMQGPVTCGRNTTVSGISPAVGKLCQVRIRVENTGTKARVLTPENQKLLDAGDTKVAGVRLLEGGTARARSAVPRRLLRPGDTFAGFVIFDVATAYQPTAVVLHDAGASRGVRIPTA
jgi:serine/threonine protein kinase